MSGKGPLYGARLRGGDLVLTLDPKTVRMLSLRVAGEEFLSPGGGALCRLQLLNAVGNPRRLSDSDARNRKFMKMARDTWRIRLERLADLDLAVELMLHVDATGAIQWRAGVENRTRERLEWIDFPSLSLRGDFVAQGGRARLFWPGNEGCLIEDPAIRQGSWFRYNAPQYPSPGLGGAYPGPCPMQFMAYFRAKLGLYIAAHDPDGHTKHIEFDLAHATVRPEFAHFTAGHGAGRLKLPYPMVLRAFKGDWYDAATLYRDWSLRHLKTLPATVRANQRFPAWVAEPPLVVIYPVTGRGSHSGPTRPNEYFPLKRALPALDGLAARLDTKLMALLMHWEGTAPWAPPYTWPPRGGAKAMERFAGELQRRGHKLGLYCSGTGWTQFANTGSGRYNREREFAKRKLARFMCRGPRHEMVSRNCNTDDLRWGYDICAATRFAREVMRAEALKIAAAGVDYIQLFDQNLGGGGMLCYSDVHGHPPGPGPWQRRAMSRMFADILRALRRAGRETVLGCEGTAAETFLGELPVNDLRWNFNFEIGTPVPAFSYVYHEYVRNFQGNQCIILDTLDEKRSPLNFFYRLAYSFAAGDALTVILKDGGEIHWGWCVSWDLRPPPQIAACAFIRDLLEWRREAARDYLVDGLMLKPFDLQGATLEPIYLRRGDALRIPAVLTSRWRSPSGGEAQICVNWTDRPRRVRVRGVWAEGCALRRAPRAAVSKVRGRSPILDLPPFAAALLEKTP